MATDGSPEGAGEQSPGARGVWLRARRAEAQLLDRRRARPVEEVVGRLLAVQAQDPRAAGLALRARSAGATAGEVERAIGEERSLVVSWLGRGTLHLVCREDYPWLLGLTAPTRWATSRRRLAQEGVPPDAAERAIELIGRALGADGPLSRSALSGRLEAAGIRMAGQAAAHLVMLSALRGITVVCGRAGRHGEPTLALTEDWLGGRPAIIGSGVGRERAVGELARRYLVGHGPASAADLATWSGLPLGDARRGLAGLGRALIELEGGLVALAGQAAVDGLPAAYQWSGRPARQPACQGAGQPAGGGRLLGAYDPYMLGWKDRGFAVAAAGRRVVHPGGGVIRPVATSGGRVVATWGATRGGEGLQVTVRPFEPVAAGLIGELEAEAADVARFEGIEAAGPIAVDAR